MTAPAGLTRLAPPPSLLSPAPSATLSPPLSEPDQQRPYSADAGGRLSFFGRDGHVLLELSHGPLDAWERQKRWVAVSRKPYWPPVTVAAPVGNITAQHGAVGQSCRPSPRPAEPAARKQPTPGRRVAGAVLCRGRRAPLEPGGALSPACLRRLSRRPCRAARPVSGPQPGAAPSAAGTPARRAARLADAVCRLAERRQQRTHRGTAVTRPATPRKRCPVSAGRAASSSSAARSTVRPSPAAAGHRQSTVHSIDSLLSTQSRAAPPPTPPLVVPTPVRPSPYAVYAAYLARGAGELCVVPPPAGCAPLPPLSPLLLAQLSGAAAVAGGGGGLLTVQARPSPAHSAAGWHAAAYDYSCQSSDEPLNLSTR